MNEIVRQAEAALRRHAAPALRLRELLRLVRTRTSDRTLDARLLLTLLEEHPDRFRVLDPWQGPWRLAGIAGDTGEGAEDPWVVLVTDPGEQDLADPRLAARLRESVRWMARGIDPRARRELIRWHAMMIAAEDARALLVRRAA